jgi:hypothetical protein
LPSVKAYLTKPGLQAVSASTPPFSLSGCKAKPTLNQKENNRQTPEPPKLEIITRYHREGARDKVYQCAIEAGQINQLPAAFSATPANFNVVLFPAMSVANANSMTAPNTFEHGQIILNVLLHRGAAGRLLPDAMGRRGLGRRHPDFHANQDRRESDRPASP